MIRAVWTGGAQCDPGGGKPVHLGGGGAGEGSLVLEGPGLAGPKLLSPGSAWG